MKKSLHHQPGVDAMCAVIERRGMVDPAVLAAMRRVPRERFVPDDVRPRAYGDHALSIGHGQTISQPYVVAAMTEALELKGDERVLEIGTGSGYQTAILAILAGSVYTVERIAALSREAAEQLDALGLGGVHYRVGDGSLGWPEEAPFEAILVGAGAPAAPPALLDQLDPNGGRLVAPVGSASLQHLLCIIRDGTTYHTRSLMECRFVPLLGAEGWEA